MSAFRAEKHPLEDDYDNTVGYKVKVYEGSAVVSAFELRFTQCCGLDELCHFEFPDWEQERLDAFRDFLMAELTTMTNGAVMMVFRNNKWRADGEEYEYKEFKASLKRYGCNFSKQFVNMNSDNILSVCVFLPNKARGDV